MRGVPCQAIGSLAGGDKARNRPRSKIDFRNLVAIDARYVGDLAVGTNQNLLWRLTDSNRARNLHGIQVDDSYIVFIWNRDEQPAAIRGGGASITGAIERNPALELVGRCVDN